MENWYVLYTKPRCEQQVERGLAANGIEVYCPSLRIPPRKGRPSTRPFFPCYLFARVDLDQVGLSRLNWTPGMRHVVEFGGVPSHVDESVIARIRERLARSGAVDDSGEMLEEGDRVVITSGPLQDIEAVFDKRLSSAGRVRVLVQLLRRWTTIDLEASALRKAGGLSIRSKADNLV